MDANRISKLLAGFVGGHGLSMKQLSDISTYIDILLLWNSKMSLTSVRAPEEIVKRHFGESLFAASALFGKDGSAEEELSLVDVGSGAGFPGIPLKIYAPNIKLTLIESQQKKAVFLKEVVRALTLTGVDVFAGRVEEFAHKTDVVTLRAVEKFESVVRAAASLVREPVLEEGSVEDVHRPGRIALLISEEQIQRAKDLLQYFAWDKAVKVPQSSARVLLIGRRIRR